ncbi:MAG: hypothetical protein ACKVOH_02970 [Chlamydiales bacterium]
MAKGLWRSTFIGGFIAWLWIVISWTIIPWHCPIMNSFPNEAENVKTITSMVGTSGIYMSPNQCSGMATKPAAKSPIVFLSVNMSGNSDNTIIPYVISLIIYFIGALLIALVIMQMASSGYGSKLFAVTMIGLVIGFMAMLPGWNWMGYPFNFVLLMIVDSLIAWFLAGLVIAGFVHPKHHKEK